MNRLREISGDFVNEGIFTALDSLAVPWRGVVPFSLVNLQYYTNRSGNKAVSPLVDYLLENDGGVTLSTASVTRLAGVAHTMYGKSWEKLYRTLSLNYDPIENYSMIETEESNGEESISGNTTTLVESERSNTGTQKTDESGTQTGTVTDRGTLTHTGTQTVTADGTQTGTVTDSGSTTHTGTQTTESNGTDGGTFSRNAEHKKTGTVTDAETSTDSGTISHEGEDNITRNGETNVNRTEVRDDSTAVEESVYAFNSEIATKSNSTVTDVDGSLTVNEGNTNTGSEKVTKSDTETRNLSGGRDNTQTHDTTDTDSESTEDSKTHSNTDTRTDELTDTTENTRTNDLKSTESSTRTDNLEDTNDNTRTDNLRNSNTSTRTDNLTESSTDSSSEEHSDKTEISNSRRLERRGNIGVTTSQQMIQAERELWIWTFFDQVFSDLDKVITIPIY